MSTGRWKCFKNLNLGFGVPPFSLIFWRIPGYHVLKAFGKTPLRYVTINFDRRKFSLNVNALEFLTPIPLNSCHSLNFFTKPKPWYSLYLLFLDILEDFRISCSQCTLQESHEVQKEWVSLVINFTKSKPIGVLKPWTQHPQKRRIWAHNPADNRLEQHRENFFFWVYSMYSL